MAADRVQTFGRRREGGLFSGAVYFCRPPRYEYVFFLKIVSLKLRRGGRSGKAYGSRDVSG